MRLVIFGAGMAGLLAAQMLRRYSPEVREAQPSLPDNHGALLRFRSDVVARATGQSFRRVRVQKAIRLFGRKGLFTSADLRMSNMYAYKVGGEVMDRSILSLEPVERYIAPPDFISNLAVGMDIKYGQTVDQRALNYYTSGKLDRGIDNPSHEPHRIISTIPMPAMMDLVGWKDKPDFRFRSITSVTYVIPDPRVDVYQTIYYPDPEGERYYRASLTGNLLTIEYIDPPKDIPEDIINVCEDFGLVRVMTPLDGTWKEKHQKYGKLLPIDEAARRSFIYGLSLMYGIYSVGRFATWRQILLDDVVSDIQTVEGFMLDKDRYKEHLSTQKG